MTVQPSKLTTKDFFAYFLFWSWNMIFLAFMVFGFAPRLLPDLLVDVRAGWIPLNYLIYAIVLSCIPLLAVILGATLLRRQPARLFAVGYVVEGPIMLLLAVRFFLIRQSTPALALLLVVTGLGMAAFLAQVLDPSGQRGGRFLSILRLAGLTLMLLVSLYAAVWILFYAVPLFAMFLNWLGRVLGNLPAFWRDLAQQTTYLFGIENLMWLPFSILSFLLILYTATLFVVAPLVIPLLSVRYWLRSMRLRIQASGRLVPVATALLTVAVVAVLAVLFNRQPQQSAFRLLQQPPTSPAEAQTLLDNQETIRRGLLNAYLAPFRYISALGEVSHIRDIYQAELKLSSESAYMVQRAYERVAMPILYEPVTLQDFSAAGSTSALQREPRDAARLYQRFFDEPIVEAERQQIVSAVRSTWDAGQAETAWQAVDEHEVHLDRQEITVAEHGDWAEIELFEVYRNITQQNQEVIYYFNLPESAVLTGVWLGNTPDREHRFAFQVAPRGAAQAVFRNEVRQNRDPALLEQIGPRQYRLRVFPVPAVVTSWNDDASRRVVEEAPPLYMWLTYRTLAQDGEWPLPRLAFKHNIFWDNDTQRLLNNEPVETPTEEAWTPEAAPAIQAVQPLTHRVDFPGGMSVVLTPEAQVTLPVLPAKTRLAVVLDRSRSMVTQQALVTAALARLQQPGEPSQAVDVYQTSSAFRGEAPSLVSLDGLDLNSVLYFGGQNPAELLRQFNRLRQGRAYDGILVLTDGSGYELGASELEVPVPDAPVWMVHLGSDIPLGYDDATLQAIQASGGGVTGDLEQALLRLAVSMTSGELGMQDLVDGYYWSVQPLEQAGVDLPQAEIHSGDDGFIALAARRFILAEMRRNRGSITQLETLDQLHALAQQYGIVTPYSSMIVLVNSTQEDLLEHLEQGSDRFEREVEDLGDTTPATQSPLTGVPEPEEWLLIGLAVAILLWYGRSHLTQTIKGRSLLR